MASKSQQRKIAKKNDRKRFKIAELLRKSSDINLKTYPTKHLLVSNGGLGNCVGREDIVELFRPYGLLDGVIMQERVPHCFVTFADIDSATRALKAVDGHQLVHGHSLGGVVTLYVSYVDKVPELIPVDRRSPRGLYLIEDFIDEETEGELQQLVVWQDADDQSSLKHRRVKHYGYEFNYDTNNVDRDRPLVDPMPRLLTDIIEKIMGTGHVTCRPDQVTVNQYLPGQGIPPHVDTHSAFQDAIVSLSVGSMVSMDFTHPDGTHVAEVLPPRSLLVMTGEARYLWNHGITPRKNDIIPDASPHTGKEGLTLAPRGIRTSFTFRAVRGRPCECDFPAKCDSQQERNLGELGQKPSDDPEVKKPSSEAEAIKLEHSQVHDVYNEIAPHFSNTRYKPWPRVAAFLNELEEGSVVLDVGCGNGKYIGVNPDVHMVGCDRSSELIAICAERGHEVFVCDGLEVPVASDVFDACISIAVIHHFSTQSRRLKALRELARLLRPGGLALVYVWAMEQQKHNKKSKYLTKKKECSKREVGMESETIASSNEREGNTEESACGHRETEFTPEEESLDLRAKLEELNLSGNEMNRISTPGLENSGETSILVGDKHLSRQNIGVEIEGTTDSCESCISSADQSHIGGSTSSDRSSGMSENSCISVKSDAFSENSGDTNHCKKMSGVVDHSVAIGSRINTEIYQDSTSSSGASETRNSGVSEHDDTSVASVTHSGSVTEGIPAPSADGWGCRQSSERALNLTVHVNKTEFRDQDLLVPWHLKSKVKQGSSEVKQGSSDAGESIFYRFYHVFREGELETLVAKIGGVSIEESYYDQGNWCVIFRKNVR